MTNCNARLGCGGATPEVCQACYVRACESVASLRNIVRAQSEKMETYGSALRAEITQLKIELYQAHSKIRYLEGE